MRVHGVRRVPLIGANRKLVGIVTLDDLLKGLAAEANALADIMERERETRPTAVSDGGPAQRPRI